MSDLMMREMKPEITEQKCINCLHCHLFHQEKEKNRYCCQRPNKQALFISNPHTKQMVCQDFVLLRQSTYPPIIKLCEDLHHQISTRRIPSKNSDFITPVTAFLTQEIYSQVNAILLEVFKWEKNKLTNVESDLLTQFYFELAGHSILRIVHIKHS